MKHFKISIILSFYFLLIPFLIFSQSGIVVSGGNIKSSTGSLSYSIGQSFFQFQKSPNGTLWEGLQHPWETLVITSINEGDDRFSLGIKIYPNPTSDFLIIENEKISNEGYSLTIFNLSGSIQKEFNLHSTKEKISLNELPNGIYLIAISDLTRSKFLNSYRLIKTEF